MKIRELHFRDAGSGRCPACGEPKWDYCVNPKCPIGETYHKYKGMR